MKTYATILLLGLSAPVMADNWFIRVSAEHTSNYLIKEKGYGLNAAFADLGYRNNGWVIFAGIGAHEESIDCPEVCFGGDELARFGASYEWRF